jgi:hypothetical protein
MATANRISTEAKLELTCVLKTEDVDAILLALERALALRSMLQRDLGDDGSRETMTCLALLEDQLHFVAHTLQSSFLQGTVARGRSV